MELYYNGTDIYDDVAVNYCVHEMFAEKQADSLVIRFGDPDGIWSKWKPAEGDEIRFKHESADTGKMFIHSIKPENGLFTIRALSMTPGHKTKKSKSWEGVRFLQLGNEIARNNGLIFRNYGCINHLYPYWEQKEETDFAMFSRLCMLEGAQMLIYDGKLLAYSERLIESQPTAGKLEIGENGNFTYHDRRGGCYGACEVASGGFYGKYATPCGDEADILRATGIKVTSNAQAARFACGLLRDANKYGRTGQFSKSLQTEYGAASILTLMTPKAVGWNGDVFIYKMRHDYIGNLSTIYFRDILEGY